MKWWRNSHIMWCHHHILRRQREQFLTYYLPTESNCHSFNALEVPLPPPPPFPTTLRDEKKSPCSLNRVKFPTGIEFLKARRGNFSSPGFPAFYPNDARKIWIIGGSEARVELTFNAFSVQSCTDCSCDCVEVRDGPYITSPLIGRLCGNRTKPITMVSSQEYLFAYFKSDSSVSGRGFSARYAHTTSKYQFSFPENYCRLIVLSRSFSRISSR